MSYPATIPSYAGFTSGHTLAQDTHAAQHNSEQADITAIATKIGTGASTPTSGVFLRGNGTGTSAWSQIQAASDLAGSVPVSQGGSGTTTTTGTAGSNVLSVSPTISSPSISGGTFSGNPTFTGQPTITDFTNADHTHASVSQGGTLNAANALQAGSLPYSIMGTDSSYAWIAFTPNWTNFTIGTGGAAGNVGYYKQVGKTVFFYVFSTLGTSGQSVGSSPYFIAPKPVSTAHYVQSAINIVAQGNSNVASQNTFTFINYNSGIATDALQPVYMPTSTTLSGMSSTTPATWVAGNSLMVQGFYEAA